jgi:hypothetical protein
MRGREHLQGARHLGLELGLARAGAARRHGPAVAP